MIKNLNFTPLPFLSCPHLQMITASFASKGKEPISEEMRVLLDDGAALSCLISTPLKWKETLVLIHGLGGTAQSNYMVRLARKGFEKGYRVVRINLRGCGSGKGLSHLPYNSGNSDDVKKVLGALEGPLILIGYSLGGNIALKLAGELKETNLVKQVIGVCPVLSLDDCSKRIEKTAFGLYNKYYVRSIENQTKQWTHGKHFQTIYEFDEGVTAPAWGYLNAHDYYDKCSSENFISQICLPCDILLAQDDPFIDYQRIQRLKIKPATTVWLTKKGSHTGFIGYTDKWNDFYWLDQFLLNRIGNF